MSYFGKNIKKIRRLKKLSQRDFAELFDLSRASIGAYEEERAEPKIDTVINVANYFSINIEGLICRDLTVNEISHFDIFKHGASSTIQRVNLPTEKIIHIVKHEQQNEYAKDIHSKVKEIKLPVLKLRRKNNTNGKIRAFEVCGSAMYYQNEGFRNKDLVICAEIKNIDNKELILGKPYVIVTKNDCSLLRLINIDNLLLFGADNPDYDKQTYAVEHINELWEVFGCYSEKLDNRVSLLEKRILELENKKEGSK